MPDSDEMRLIPASPNEIAVPVWIKRGIMMIRRDALEPSDPDHPRNYIRNVLGLDPAQYGYPEQSDYCPTCGSHY